MLGLAEMAALNAQFSLTQRGVKAPRGVFIIKVEFGGRTLYFDPAGYFMHDRSLVGGWHDYESAEIVRCIQELKQMVHLETKIMVDTR